MAVAMAMAVTVAVAVAMSLAVAVAVVWKDVYLPCVSYHLPTTDVRLFLPQTYHQLHGGSSTIDGANVCMRLRGRRPNITIPIACGGTILPCVYNSFVSEKVKREYASKNLQSALKVSRLFYCTRLLRRFAVHHACSR
jgi:hypothetical protein